jgi:hypothetical protein
MEEVPPGSGCNLQLVTDALQAINVSNERIWVPINAYPALA